MAYNEVRYERVENGYKITLIGEPISWSPPRYSKNGSYDLKWKQKRDACLLIDSLGLITLPPPLVTSALFVMPIPKSLSKRKRNALLETSTSHQKTPDLDNCYKFVSDVLQASKVVDNDAQVATITLRKIYGEEPRAEITITTETKENT